MEVFSTVGKSFVAALCLNQEEGLGNGKQLRTVIWTSG